MSLEKRTYDNGLTVYTDHMPEAATTAVQVHIPFGSVHEVAGEEGIAHALEHAVFIETDEFPDQQAVNLHARVNGMYQNANTYYTRTLHITHGLRAGPAFRHLGEVLQRTHIPDEGAATEMMAVRREAKTDLDDVPSAHASSRDLAMAGIPYGRRVIGFHDRLNFTGEQLRQVYAREYRLGAMTIVAVGAAAPSDIYEYIDRYFDLSGTDSAPERDALPVPTHTDALVSGFIKPESQNLRISVSYPLPESFVTKLIADTPRYNIASSIVSDACFRTLRDEKHISYDGGVGLSTYNHPNAWSLGGYVTTDTPHLAMANQVFETVLHAGNEVYTDEQIAGGLKMGKFNALRSINDVEHRINTHMTRLIKGMGICAMPDLTARIRRLTPNEIRTTIDEFIDITSTQPRYEHRTGTSEAIGSVDRIIEPANIM